MVKSTISRLAEVFSQVTDPRKARGGRHPYPGIVSLVFLGLLALHHLRHETLTLQSSW